MNAYIYEGYTQRGGTYMAYHIGRILYEYFSCEVMIVGNRPGSMMFSYPIDFPTVTQDLFESMLTEDDLLICNPSFSGQNFGLRLPCKKLSYVQNVRTFRILDVFFDHYVFVSGWVKWFIEKYYGITGTVVPAFIHTDVFTCTTDWADRKSAIPITGYKGDDLVLNRIRKRFIQKYPNCPLEFTTFPVMGQKEFAAELGKHRYYLSLACMEGFGLPMLEAMAVGCAAVGWDAGGSSEYTLHGENCLISRYGDLEHLVDNLHYVLTKPDEAERLADAGARTALQFGQKRFDDAWVAELARFLKVAPALKPRTAVSSKGKLGRLIDKL